MKAYFDTEFAHISMKRVSLVSIAIIRDDGQRLYLVSNEFKYRPEDWWFKKNVLKVLEDTRHPLSHIEERVQLFLIPVCEVVTREGGHDFKILEQLVGPSWFQNTDINKLWELRGKPELPKRPKKQRHHALVDAEFYKSLYHLVI